MVLLMHCKSGGYDSQLGWTSDSNHAPVFDCRRASDTIFEAMDAEDLSGTPILVGQHLQDVGKAAEELEYSLPFDSSDVPWSAVVRAAWWHDVGKAHPAFQGGIMAANPTLDGGGYWAKSGTRGYLQYQLPVPPSSDDSTKSSELVDVVGKTQSRRGFRHELASALAWLQQHDSEPDTDLIAYLIAAHHGKVRLSIRSMPNEDRPPEPGTLFARGIWHRDVLPFIAIRNSQSDVSEEIELSLELMQLGLHNDKPSWLARTTRLLESFGPFRLAFLETLVRVADWRGSNKGGQL